MKTYSSKSNVRRAAKSAGLTEDQYEIITVDGGKFAMKEVVIEQGKTRQEIEADIKTLQEKIAKAKDLKDLAICHNDLELVGDAFALPVMAALIRAIKDKTTLITKANEKPVPAMHGIEHTRESVISNPVKTVWHIADEMFDAAEKVGDPAPRRKEVLAECVKRGIAFYTARTQYQQWWLCRNGKFK